MSHRINYMINGKTGVYGILGWPVSHSVSPALHNAAFAALRLDACYVPFPVAPERLEAAVRSLVSLGIRGVNVTVPHKVAVMPFLDAVVPDAVRTGAVNVVTVRDDGSLEGHNTDSTGFLRFLDREGIAVEGKKAIVLGAGGAARAVVESLSGAAPAEIVLLNRTLSKARAIAAIWAGARVPVNIVEFSDPKIDTRISDADIIINATSLGLKPGDPPPIEKRCIRPGAVCVDLIYNPWETVFMKTAADAGAAARNGYGMLVYQAAEAFAMWMGQPAPVDVMWNAGLQALGRGV